jgi:hypothetical protein
MTIGFVSPDFTSHGSDHIGRIWKGQDDCQYGETKKSFNTVGGKAKAQK